MNKKILIVFLLSVLVIMSFVQGVQINNIKKSFSEGATGAAVSQPSPSPYRQPAANVPAMIGGC